LWWFSQRSCQQHEEEGNASFLENQGKQRIVQNKETRDKIRGEIIIPTAEKRAL